MSEYENEGGAAYRWDAWTGGSRILLYRPAAAAADRIFQTHNHNKNTCIGLKRLPVTESESDSLKERTPRQRPPSFVSHLSSF